MKKILLLFHPLEASEQHMQEYGKEQFAPHHLWCYDQFKEMGYEVDFLPGTKETSFLNRLGKALKIRFLEEQIAAILKVRSYDVIFLPYIDYGFLIALMRTIGLVKKPLIAIAHHAYPVNTANPLKRLKHELVRYFYFKGTDTILFYSDYELRNAKKYKHTGNFHLVDSWGVDGDFYQSFIAEQADAPRADFVFATGGSYRDFTTLVKAFDGLDQRLKITTVGHLDIDPDCPIPANVTIDNSLGFSMSSPGIIRKDYYHASAVAVPLQKIPWEKSYGITVAMEAMAMGKPIIATHNKTYWFNIEKEKVGLLVDHGDVEGWRQALQFLRDHPEEAREMGARGAHLIRQKYNYKKFSKDVAGHIDQLITSVEVKDNNTAWDLRRSSVKE